MTSPTPNDWHAQPAHRALAHFNSHIDGLSHSEAELRMHEFGPNRLPARAASGPVKRFFLQFHNLLIYVLLLAALVTLALGEWLDSTVIFGVVVINALVGFVQEGKAEQAMQAIQQMLTLDSTVRRAGQTIRTPAEQLVPGDLVVLEAGDRVPADMRLLECRDLRIEEATLTGESVPVDKQIEAVPGEASLGDRRSMAYSGTLVSAGSGMGVVVATAGQTELGGISHMLGEVVSLQTPLLTDMARFAKQLTVLILLLALATFAFGVLLRDYGTEDMLLAAVGLAVAAIPEGLPAVLTITLALGVQRMARRRAIIRRLPAVESLGAVTVICTDKTGTLTRNEMTVQQVYTAAHHYQIEGIGYAPEGYVHCDGAKVCVIDEAHDLKELARAGLLCNSASLQPHADGWSITGDPTEAALLTLAGKLNLQHAHESTHLPRVDIIPFSSERRAMASLHHDHFGHGLIYMIGAPERLLELCNRQWRNGTPEPIDLRYWHQVLAEGATQGLRMLALALRPLDAAQHELDNRDLEGDMVLLGLVGMLDPPRDEAICAIAECAAAGIQVKMITGDHAATASAIAKKAGAGRQACVDWRRSGSSQRRRARRSTKRNRRVRPHQPYAQAAIGPTVTSHGCTGCDDGRWRQRRPGAQARRYRYCHGYQGHRGCQGGVPNGASRRQLRHHRPCGRRRPCGLRQPEEIDSFHPAHERRRSLGITGCDCAGAHVANHAATSSLGEHDHRRDTGPGVGIRAGRARPHASSTS